MITENDVKWGKYTGGGVTWEGPFFPGKIKYVAPVNMDFRDKALAVLTATEGAAYDAINMYDRCILSVGLVQWCDAMPQGSTTKLLGKCAEMDSFMMGSLIKKFPIPVEFKKNAKGEWRFYLNGVEVNTQELQRQLYFNGPHTGKQGTWTEANKLYAKKVAAWFANIWDVPLFRTVQAEMTKSKLEGFAMPEAKEILFKDKSPQANESWSGALRAAFLSFSGNIPVVANNSLKRAVANPEWATADAADRFRIALQALTFSPNISIYPGRYNKIAPVISRLFGVQIPLSWQDLKEWSDAPAISGEISEEEQSIVDKVNGVLEDAKKGICEFPIAEHLLGKICHDL